MDPSSLQVQSQALGQPDILKFSFLNEVEKNFSQKNYSGAFDRLVIFFMSPGISDDEAKQAYGYLCACLPYLEATRVSSLMDKIFPGLYLFSHLTLQQFDLALALANWYANQPSTTEDILYQNALQ